MAAQRYDIPGTGHGGFVERYWTPANLPSSTPPDGSSERRLDEAESDLSLAPRSCTTATGNCGSRATSSRCTHCTTLTGLRVRPVLLDQLTHAPAPPRRHDGCVAVFFIDLDRFKQVNDAHGHAARDALLRCIADRLREEGPAQHRLPYPTGGSPSRHRQLAPGPRGRRRRRVGLAGPIDTDVHNCVRGIGHAAGRPVDRPSGGVQVQPLARPIMQGSRQPSSRVA
jgi:hypothetical protein